MNFQLTKSQKEVQRAAAEFAKGEFDKDRAQELDQMGKFPKDIRQQAAELGFIGIHVPEDYAGGGMGVFENTLVAETLCRKDSTLGAAVMLSSIGMECLVRFGTQEQKEMYLPEIVEGRAITGLAFAESGIGFFDGVIETTAFKSDDGWVINGNKTQVINGGLADIYFLLCRTDPEKEMNKGVSILILDRTKTTGVSFDQCDKLGLRMTPSAHMDFNNVCIPSINLLGKENGGLGQALKYYNESMVLIAGLALGTAEGALDRAIAYVKEREQFGRKIGQFQVTQHKLADMATRIEQSRYLTYAAALSFEQRKPDNKLAAMAKLSATQTAVDVAGETIQLLGGYGYMTEYEVERFYRDAKVMEIFGSNTGMLKDTIAGDVIGKIR
jgi:alkylation response protein AidB-like acyl-CoA dehydrogenase